MTEDAKPADDAAPPADVVADAPNPDLVLMTKDGETINVHKNGVAEHIGLGWTVV